MTEALFLAVPETADLLGVSDDLVYDMIHRGELPAATFGRRRMVPRVALERVVERALDSFDPDTVLARLAGAGDSSSASGSSSAVDAEEGPPGLAGPETGVGPASVAPRGAPA